LLLALLAGFAVALLAPVSPFHPRSIDFLVLPGEGLREIATHLEELGLIRERHAFVALALARGQSGSLLAGPYRATTKDWAWDLLDRLVEGTFQDTTVTVPEGRWLTEVAEIAGPLVEGGADSFLVAARDSAWLADQGIPASTAEGYLFPDTYRVIPGVSSRDLVRHMVRTFFQAWEGPLAARADSLGRDLHEVVTLASIVEAEAQVPEERPRIAAVYLNRLARGLPLQADPTVHYGIGRRLGRTLLDDLKHSSPYNTYLNPGLPPGPICNPGLGALQAALWPLPGCEDLYFVARGDGTHLFAPDFAGHLRNRRIIRSGAPGREDAGGP
jgi:UPF0755 protein